MKKTILLISLGILIGSTAVFAATKVFSDVPANSFYADAVANLSEKGIINGYPDGTFGPGNNVNRAELAVMLDRTLKYIDANEESSLSMEDAKVIAEDSVCMDEGDLTGEYFYNDSSKTWWFDMDTEKPGCMPACVVDEETEDAEINWRCTGLAL